MKLFFISNLLRINHLFFAKENPRVHFVSPVSGEVTAIVRGAKRKILEVVVTQDDAAAAVKHEIPELNALDQEQIKEILLKAGAWPFITQRPYGTIASPEDTPKAIFVSTYTSAPLDVDYDFLLKNNKVEFQKGIDVLAKLTENLTLTADANFKGFFEKIDNANIVGVSGLHPAGNVGVQSSAIVVQGLTNNTVDGKILSRLLKEFFLGLVNGLAIAAIVLVISHFVFETSYLESLTICVALITVIIMAALIGTFVPIFLDKRGIDAAVATGPFITTSNDVFGIFIYFLIAKMILQF